MGWIVTEGQSVVPVDAAVLALTVQQVLQVHTRQQLPQCIIPQGRPIVVYAQYFTRTVSFVQRSQKSLRLDRNWPSVWRLITAEAIAE